MNPPLETLEKAIGYTFRNRRLLRLALVHPSFRHEAGRAADNQRLEFLGDAALGMVAAARLYRRFPKIPEGELTRLRSGIASELHLAGVGRRWSLGEHLRLGKGERSSGGAQRASVLADAVEAVLGAACLDGDLAAVEQIFRRHFWPAILAGHREEHVNPKGTLQERIQKQGQPPPSYHVHAEHGPAHQPHYEVEVRAGGKIIGRGAGPNKREAEKAAAGDALAQLGAKTSSPHE
jgi:ribonuclease III